MKMKFANFLENVLTPIKLVTLTASPLTRYGISSILKSANLKSSAEILAPFKFV